MPDPYGADTDVVSFLFRHDTRGEIFRPYLKDSVILVSFMTIAELERWSLQRNWGPGRRQTLMTYLDEFTNVLGDRSLCRV